eukprot:14507781-Alexandrium_andersonii.AAC.1
MSKIHECVLDLYTKGDGLSINSEIRSSAQLIKDFHADVKAAQRCLQEAADKPPKAKKAKVS